MASKSFEGLVQQIKDMSVLELSNFVKELETTFGVSAAIARLFSKKPRLRLSGLRSYARSEVVSANYAGQATLRQPNGLRSADYCSRHLNRDQSRHAPQRSWQCQP